ncbi:hypothetical protein GH714_012450 [Hevea brasiliensis]|uniref:RING-type E3 ubiquitin transferase n=1 Tax=Hevea brasiliensis TaxID=3981 RepID=A0A6A6LFY6_HEVBR|nr:hypothetical protein GH714_012450 [Hevea brasiliensis]
MEFLNPTYPPLHDPALESLSVGNLPASQANVEVVSVHRRQEREQTKKLLEIFLAICHRAKVEASIVTTDCDQVQKGIVELLNRHDARMLVMGAVPENCMKVKKSSNKANYVAKSAPIFCEIWFINKGKHVWMREASESSFSPRSSSSTSTERRVSSDSDSKVEEESLYCQLERVRTEAEASRNEAFEELLKRKKLEFQTLEAISKVKIFDSAYANEVKLRKEAENALRNTIEEREKLLEEKEEVTKERQRAMRNVALLDSRVQESNRRRTMLLENCNLFKRPLHLCGRKSRLSDGRKWKLHIGLSDGKIVGKLELLTVMGCLGLLKSCLSWRNFQYLICKPQRAIFSESFKLGQGGYGYVYKGEMLGRTVAIKKLYPNNMQGQSEFQKEVQVLGKLQHPHLVTLLGACPEAWSLVYEYLPNGSLHDCLFRRSNISSLTWKVRARIIAEISSALCFLHSSKPEKIIHGDLKPQNILLDSELSCKICEFGICRLVTDDTLSCPSFRRGTEPKGAFPYTDPEFRREGVLTTKSDIYSFGVIILQLITGRPPFGLVGEVRRTMSCGKLASILDPSAGEWPTFVAKRLVDLGLHSVN